MKNFKIISAIILVLLFLVYLGCKRERLNPYDHYAYKVVVFDTAGVNNVSSITSYDTASGSVTFSGSAPVVVNDIVVSVPCTAAPDGFLRKVTSVNGNTISTVQATLEEAIQDGETEYSLELTQSKMNKKPAATKTLKGVKLLEQAEKKDKSFNFNLSLDDVVIYDDDGNENTTNDQIMFNGYVNFNTEFKVKIKINNWKLDYFLFQNTSTEEANLELSTTLLSLPLINKEITFWEHYFAPVTIMVGLIPVVIVPKLKLVVGANGKVSVNISTDVTQQASLTTGIIYENENWTPFADFTKSFQYNPPSLSAELDLKGYAGPQLDLLLYGVAGPYANLDAYAQLTAQTSFQNNIDWSLYGGIELVAGAEVEVLSHILANVEWKIIDEKIMLANGQITVSEAPVANFSATPTTGNAPLNVIFSDLTANTPTSWNWNFGDGGTSSLQNPSHTYNTAGTYTISLTATNTNGSDIEIKNNYINVNTGTGTVTDIDGNVYNTVTIGSQVWMVENLKTTHYRDGTAIPNVTDNTAWNNLTTGAYCNYNNTASNATTYGRLYNWYAVNNSSKLAPKGWHVPTDAEWKTLEMALGMTQASADSTGWRGTNESGKLKETGTTHWNSPNTSATNSSGFGALPGGYRNYNGTDDNVGDCGYWWSATAYGATYAWRRYLFYNNSQVYRSNYYKTYGFSVRCVRDF